MQMFKSTNIKQENYFIFCSYLSCAADRKGLSMLVNADKGYRHTEKIKRGIGFPIFMVKRKRKARMAGKSGILTLLLNIIVIIDTSGAIRFRFYCFPL